MVNANSRHRPDCVLGPRLCRELIHELRIAALFLGPTALPPPSDTEAEQDVVSGLLWGTLMPADLAPLGPEHLVVPLFREVLTAATALAVGNKPVGPQSVAEHLRRAGVHSGGLEDLLEVLACLPYVSPENLRARARRVIERARARNFCKELRSIDTLLRLGDLDCDAARVRLGQLTAGVGGDR